MDILTLTAAVAIGNILTVCVVLSFREFQRRDQNASYLAYAGFVMPMLFMMGAVWLAT